MISFSPPGDVLAFAGEPILFFSIQVVLNMLPEVTTTPLVSYILGLNQRPTPLG